VETSLKSRDAVYSHNGQDQEGSSPKGYCSTKMLVDFKIKPQQQTLREVSERLFLNE